MKKREFCTPPDRDVYHLSSFFSRERLTRARGALKGEGNDERKSQHSVFVVREYRFVYVCVRIYIYARTCIRAWIDCVHVIYVCAYGKRCNGRGREEKKRNATEKESDRREKYKMQTRVYRHNIYNRTKEMLSHTEGELYREKKTRADWLL